MTTTAKPINPRTAAIERIADTIRKHLHPELQPVRGAGRIKEVAALVEAEAFSEGWPIETAIELAVEWCELQNDEAGLTHASHT
jgi:hypothetical protein